MRRVVVTGMGMVSPLACGVEASWARILKGESGARKIEKFDVSDLPSKIACQIHDFCVEQQMSSKKIDVLNTLDDAARIHDESLKRSFDVVILDPPTFSHRVAGRTALRLRAIDSARALRALDSLPRVGARVDRDGHEIPGDPACLGKSRAPSCVQPDQPNPRRT